MSDYQQNVLKVLLEKYFEGGNNRSDASAVVLKAKIDAIAEFVKQNFSE